MQRPQYKILKLCVLGDLGVGKTSLTSRFVTENFVSKYKPTYQACHFHKYLQTPDDQVYIQIWDTSGTERFRSMSPHILRDSNGALLVYDVTNMASLISLNEYWLNWVANIVPEDFRIVVVGNKADLGQYRQVDIKVGRQFAAQNELLFYETSAMTGANVEVVFLDVVNLLADTLDESFNDSVELHKIQAKNSRCCTS